MRTPYETWQRSYPTRCPQCNGAKLTAPRISDSGHTEWVKCLNPKCKFTFPRPAKGK